VGGLAISRSVAQMVHHKQAHICSPSLLWLNSLAPAHSGSFQNCVTWQNTHVNLWINEEIIFHLSLIQCGNYLRLRWAKAYRKTWNISPMFDPENEHSKPPVILKIVLKAGKWNTGENRPMAEKSRDFIFISLYKGSLKFKTICACT